jgi:hypothetical protein
VEAYTRLSGDTVEEFREGLSLGRLLGHSMGGFFRRGNPLKDWVEGLTSDFNTRLSAEVEKIARDEAARVTDSLSRLMQGLAEDLGRNAQSPESVHIPALSAHRLTAVTESLDNVLDLLRDESLSKRLRPEGLSRIGDQAVMGGFLTAVGAVIATSASAAVFDVTGGIFSTIGALLAINTLVFRRTSVIRRFKGGFDQGREQFEAELQERLSEQMQRIHADIGQAFAPFFNHLQEQEAQLTGLTGRAGSVAASLASEQRDLEELEKEAG